MDAACSNMLAVDNGNKWRILEKLNGEYSGN